MDKKSFAPQEKTSFDALIVGAGFGGLYMLHKLRALGISARVVEAGPSVGGTWFWNCYPGARCDVESMQYSYSFNNELQQEWKWRERYATQPEILSYINHVADRFDLRRDIEFNTKIISASFEESSRTWAVTAESGKSFNAKFCIMATGPLSAANIPNIPGLSSFDGNVYHTAAWPRSGVDFTGRSVGVIGTGSSGIQSIPMIAKQAKHLFVFQRTAHYSVPAKNADIWPEQEHYWKSQYPTLRQQARETPSGVLRETGNSSAMAATPEERQAEYMSRWNMGGAGFVRAYNDLTINQASNDTAAEFVRDRIAEIVKDGVTADNLMPRDYPIGTKRICLDIGYFETFNRPNVTLVNIKKDPIKQITTGGIETPENEYAFDDLVLATGFDALTGALNKIDIVGIEGKRLRDKWHAGPRSYLGLSVSGFPNLFILVGAGSPSVLTNMVVSIEQHVEWIANCINYMNGNDFDLIEATQSAEDKWVDHVNELVVGTLYPKAASWLMGANIPGKPRIFLPYLGGAPRYRKICDEVAAEEYRGFKLDGPNKD